MKDAGEALKGVLNELGDFGKGIYQSIKEGHVPVGGMMKWCHSSLHCVQPAILKLLIGLLQTLVDFAINTMESLFVGLIALVQVT